MKIIWTSLIVYILSISSVFAQESDLKTGAVIIGITGDIDPTLNWRPFDPAKGKLMPFKRIPNLSKDAKTELGRLFGTIGRLGKSDKRYRNNDAGVSYRFVKLPPGVYALEAIRTYSMRAVFNGKIPIVRIVAGQTTYVGDYEIRIDEQIGARADLVERSVANARSFLLSFPELPGVLSEDGSGVATLTCSGRSVLFANQLSCDSERSMVSEITLSEADG